MAEDLSGAERASGGGSPAGRRPAGSRRRAVRAGVKVGNTTAAVLGDVVLDRVGGNPVTAVNVLSFVGAWGVFVEVYKREPSSLRELSQASGRSSRTIDRWASKFRDAFPEYRSPAVLWSQVRSQLIEEQEGKLVLDAERLALRLGGAHL